MPEVQEASTTDDLDSLALDAIEDGSEGSEAPASSQEPGSQLVTVKIDGVETQVTLEEAANGYQRQSDYTRKAQALAAQRQELQVYENIARGLQSDPAGTIRALQEAFAAEATDEEYVDPLEARIRAIEQRDAQSGREARHRQIDSEIARLHESYGDFDEKQVIEHAIQFNLSSLEAAYAHLRLPQFQADSALLARARDEQAKRMNAKNGASIVASGSGLQAGISGQASPGRMSMADAYRAAAAEYSD